MNIIGHMLNIKKTNNLRGVNMKHMREDVSKKIFCLGWAFNPAVLSDTNGRRSEVVSKPKIKSPAGIFTISERLFSLQAKKRKSEIGMNRYLIN